MAGVAFAGGERASKALRGAKSARNSNLLGAASQAQQPPTPAPAVGSPTPQIIIAGQAQRFAVPDCIPRKGDEPSREACRAITQVLRNDLRFEFEAQQFVPENLFSAITALNPDAPNFEDWKGIGAQVLVITRAEVTGGDLNLEMKVHFVSSGQVMLAKRYSGKADNPRVFAHQASDDIMTLTPIKGVAKSKIAFVSDRDASKERRTKELYIMDYDGFNPRRVTVNRSMNILPNWSPDGRTLAYVSYRQGAPEIFLAHIYEGKNTNVTGGKGGQSFAPSFSPDGKRIAYASSRGGNMDIWVSNLDGSDARRLTSNSSSETAPAWSPTGQEIAFTSDRGGSPQIYVMDSEGLNVRRLTNVGNYNDAPAWNPAKQWSEIAYTARLEGGTFDIAVIDLATHQVRQITQGRGSCEYPSWAPNGRHLVFACNRGGTWQITISDRDGRTLQALPAGAGSNAMPDWGQ
jgi:TolB protein